MTVRICASIPANTMHDVERMIKKAEEDGADFIEVRLDYLQSSCCLKEVRKYSKVPLIATNRPRAEGGLFKGPEEERIRLLFSAADSGFEFVDVELSTQGSEEIVKRLKDSGVKPIISTHIFGTTPNLSRLNFIFNRELRTRASVCKIVTSAKKFEDNIRCLQFVKASSRKANLVCFCMGELGLTSRLLSPLIGGYFTYASTTKDKKSAPGQLTVSEMQKLYEILGA